MNKKMTHLEVALSVSFFHFPLHRSVPRNHLTMSRSFLLCVDCGGAFGRHLISDFQDSDVGRLLLINTRKSHSRALVQLIPNVNTNGITSVRSIAPQIDFISPLTALATPFRASADAKRDFLNLVAHFQRDRCPSRISENSKLSTTASFFHSDLR